MLYQQAIREILFDSGVKDIAENCKICIPNEYCNHIDKACKFILRVNIEFKINLELSVKAAPYDLQNLNSHYNMILSRQFIKDSSLAFHFPSHFLRQPTLRN